jgi:hypothetical protein
VTVPRRRKYGWCKRTGKRRFATDVDAYAALAEAQFRATVMNDHTRRERRVYECDHCNGWHLTSKGKRAA